MNETNGLTVTCKVDFRRARARAADVGPRAQPEAEVGEVAQGIAGGTPGGTSPPVGRVARQLALAHYLEQLIESGAIKDYAAAARLLGVTRARLNQVVDLLNLAPALQEAILAGELAVSERGLRAVVREIEWGRQAECMP
jgi:DNA-binding transcriptional regulator YdaS (Cro superfamily)